MAIEISKGYIPGALGRVVELHGSYYHRHWSFGLFFEAKVACELAEFLRRYEDGQDGFWIAHQGGRIEGAVAIDGKDVKGEGAHLRWFIVSEERQGQGIGKRLLKDALEFCRINDYYQVFLWTFAGLDMARHLYERQGFRLVEQRQGNQWGTMVTEQRFLLRLK